MACPVHYYAYEGCDMCFRSNNVDKENQSLPVPFGCQVHSFCFSNKPDCVTNPVTSPVTDFADKVIDDPEKLKQRIYQLEQALSQIKEFAKVVDQ